MYFGRKSLSAFHSFLIGYGMACYRHGIANDLGLDIPGDFHDWVAYRTHFKESTSGWCNMILSTTKSEEEAFDRFFELLEDHAARKPHVVARLLNFEKTCLSCSGGESRTLKYPNSIALITYTDDPGFFAVSEEEGKSFPMEGFFPHLSWFGNFTFSSPEMLEVYDEITFSRWRQMEEHNVGPGV